MILLPKHFDCGLEKEMSNFERRVFLGNTCRVDRHDAPETNTPTPHVMHLPNDSIQWRNRFVWLTAFSELARTNEDE
jgi:hypothetical protein